MEIVGHLKFQLQRIPTRKGLQFEARIQVVKTNLNRGILTLHLCRNKFHFSTLLPTLQICKSLVTDHPVKCETRLASFCCFATIKTTSERQLQNEIRTWRFLHSYNQQIMRKTYFKSNILKFQDNFQFDFSCIQQCPRELNID